ncbi:MAG: 4-hydroxy-tetrahydrodipicolinate synthase, partial [Propionibacterium sp.]|nr:4-hydroxy-tetrahydrodipicolinate synthase [Propionibacterium sp.]
IGAFVGGDAATALAIHQQLLPVYTGVFATQGAMMVKGTLARRGFADSDLRRPLRRATTEQVDTFMALLEAAGL